MVFGEPGRGDAIARRILLPLTVLFIIVTAVFYILYDHLLVSGTSMEPTLLPGERVLVTKDYDVPERGDVVVVLGRSRGGGPEEEFIKRIVAIEGDTVEVIRGAAIVNGAPEPLAYEVILNDADVSVAEFVVPDDHVFVMGDNRPDSWDGRFFGPSPETAIVGRIVARYAPITRMGRVD